MIGRYAFKAMLTNEFHRKSNMHFNFDLFSKGNAEVKSTWAVIFRGRDLRNPSNLLEIAGSVEKLHIEGSISILQGVQQKWDK